MVEGRNVRGGMFGHNTCVGGGRLVGQCFYM